MNKPTNDWIYERLMKRSEQYIKDATSAKKKGWNDCVKNKLSYAEFCLNLAEHIRLGIQEF